MQKAVFLKDKAIFSIVNIIFSIGKGKFLSKVFFSKGIGIFLKAILKKHLCYSLCNVGIHT